MFEMMKQKVAEAYVQVTAGISREMKQLRCQMLDEVREMMKPGVGGKILRRYSYRALHLFIDRPKELQAGSAMLPEWHE